MEPDKDWPRKTWKEVVVKDVDDLCIKLSDALNRRKWRKMIEKIGARDPVIVTPRTEYELYISGAGSLRLTWM